MMPSLYPQTHPQQYVMASCACTDKKTYALWNSKPSFVPSYEGQLFLPLRNFWYIQWYPQLCIPKKSIQNLEHLQKCFKSDQIKNEPVAMDDCANNNTGCRPEIAAIVLVPTKGIIKSSRGCRTTPSILSEFHSAIFAEIMKYSIGIVALLEVLE